jgi:hypothetical protein
MSVRFLFDTAGEYVAFVSQGHLFTPECEWLGVVAARDEVYDTRGMYIGVLQADDRLVRNRAAQLPRQILAPRAPMRPVRPLPPRRRLFMPAVPPSYEDLFHGARRSLTVLTPLPRLAELDLLQGASIVADDGTFLGRISRDPTDADAIAPVSGEHGSPHGERSIFNPAGAFGSTDAPLSPFNPRTSTPPRLERGGEVLAWLTTNPALPQRVHPGELIAWIKLE